MTGASEGRRDKGSSEWKVKDPRGNMNEELSECRLREGDSPHTSGTRLLSSPSPRPRPLQGTQHTAHINDPISGSFTDVDVTTRN